MKKLITFALLISSCSFGQSVTITPTINANNSVVELKNGGYGLNHSSLNNLVSIGTFVENTNAWIQTKTDHPLRFTTNAGTTQLILATNGNFGIGDINPTQKLHVDGNANVTGTTATDGLVTANTLTIGGGNTISNIFKIVKTGATIFGVAGSGCVEMTYVAGGVSPDDTVILNIESGFGPLHVAAVIPGEDEIKVKYCNTSTASVNMTTANMRFLVIK
jgi:hypothetical protein